jgi:hypothetical protein
MATPSPAGGPDHQAVWARRDARSGRLPKVDPCTTGNATDRTGHRPAQTAPAIATSHDKLAVSNHQRGWGFYVATSGNLLMATDSLPARQARPCVRAFVLQTSGCITR